MKMDTLLLSSLTRWIRETVTLDPGESLDLMDSDVLAKIVTCITEKEGPLLKLTFGESLRLVHEFISSLPDVDTSSLTQTVRSVEESQSVHGVRSLMRLETVLHYNSNHLELSLTFALALSNFPGSCSSRWSTLTTRRSDNEFSEGAARVSHALRAGVHGECRREQPGEKRCRQTKLI